MDNKNKMDEEHERHLQLMKDTFCEKLDTSYRNGKNKHGGHLWEKEGLMDEALNGIINGFVYMLTEMKKERSGDRSKIILIDCDKTLCKGVYWTPETVLIAEPIESMVKYVNALYDKNFIVIYTARRDELIAPTLEWLRKNNIRYHAISNIKVPGDYMIDNTSVNPMDI